MIAVDRGEPTTMSRDTDRIPQDIACLETQRMPAVLMSLTGYHCEVWQTRGRLMREGQEVGLDVIIKCHKDPCPLPEVRMLQADYRRLREGLGDMVPRATFVATLVVLAEELGTNSVLTTDRRDFSVYRIGGRRAFQTAP